MDEMAELLRAIMSRLEELSAEVKGLRTGLTGVENRLTGVENELKDFRCETNERLEKVEKRLDWLGTKWLEHDAEIFDLKRKQA